MEIRKPNEENGLKNWLKIKIMRKNKIYLVLVLLTAGMLFVTASAQQLPDNHFEDWSAEFNKDKQLKDWHGSNVSQIGLKFTFMFQEQGRTGYCAYVTDKEVGALGITAVGPGYITLGTPWQYLKGLSVKSATAGTYGGIKWTHRPDTMSVWVKRLGPETSNEDFHLLYYSWTGTSEGTSYKNKVGECTEVTQINEESDIRIATDGNECVTSKKATQVAEGWYRARAKYDKWTQIKVPIYYKSNNAPTMCNVIFSAGNYPAFRANDGLYNGNCLYVDDVELIYASTIQKLLIGGVEWKEFNPNTANVQTYKLPADAKEIPAITAIRGAGSLKNIKGQTAKFGGRKLTDKEMSIIPGTINGAPTIIAVEAADGSSSHVYKIKFVK